MNKFVRNLLVCLLCLHLPNLTIASGTPSLNEDEKAIVAWIDENTDGAVDLLEEIVNINSGTMNSEGVRRVGDTLRPELDKLGFNTRWIDMPTDMNRAGHLVGEQEGTANKKILLTGHLDTVFEIDDDFQTFERIGDTARGPGIDDMKSGCVVIIYALKALDSIGALDSAQIVVFYTGDEEILGKPIAESRKHFVEFSQWADVALGFEAGIRIDGIDWATVARRSSGGWKLEVTGMQAHSSQIFSPEVGAGAIFEAARILNEFYNEVRGDRHLSFNAGSFLGGTDVEYDFEQMSGTVFGKSNVVPNKVVIQGQIRTISAQQLETTQSAMRHIVAQHLPGTDAKITFADGFPPMSPTDGNKKLQRSLSTINEALGGDPMPALDPSKRGAADISFAAPHADSLAGLGPVGADWHSPNEHIDLTTLPLAVKRAALLIYRLTRE